MKKRMATEFSRRKALTAGAVWSAGAMMRPAAALGLTGMVDSPAVRVFDVAKYGAAGDGKALDSPAIQRAIDEAAAFGGKAQVLLRGGRRYLVGTLVLKGGIDFHLADDAELLASLRREDYLGQLSAVATPDDMARMADAVIVANGAQGLRISGTGKLSGRAREFMAGYDMAGEWWLPKGWRPKMFVLTGCRDMEVRDITFAEAPNWGLHLLGCDGVLVDNVKIRNLLDVPNCDGIDPDHSRNVEIRNCDIVCGDDGIVVKTSRQVKDYGPASNIHVRDCVIETQSSALKVGSETTADVHQVLFERCKIKSCARALCIQLRDEGSVYDVAFEDIAFESRYFADPWWGKGEAISFTAIPRHAETKVGSMYQIAVRNVTGRTENSVRLRGSAESRAHDIALNDVDLTLDRWTRYKGGLYDNRPTTAGDGVVPHETVGISIEHADKVAIENCRLRWGANPPEYFGEAIESNDVTGLKVVGFDGEAARPSRTKGL